MVRALDFRFDDPVQIPLQPPTVILLAVPFCICRTSRTIILIQPIKSFICGVVVAVAVVVVVS